MFYENKGKRLIVEGESSEAKKQKELNESLEGSSSKEIIQALKTAPISKQKGMKPKDKSELTILDKIAWILQYNSKSCVAVAIANNKLLIAENHISATTGLNRSHAGLNYICKIMRYLMELSKQQAFNQQAQLFETIFESKFKGENEGFYKPVTKYKQHLLEKLHEIHKAYNNKQDRQNIIATKQAELRKLITESHQEMAAAFELGLTIIRRLYKIEKFITENPEAMLTKIFTSHVNEETLVRRYEEDLSSSESSSESEVIQPKPGKENVRWINDTTIHEIAILATNADGVHAEMKILDFLLLTEILSKKHLSEKVCIGLSKQCCLDCHDVIVVTNEILKTLTTEDKAIHVSGAHLRHFEPWSEHKPYFLQKEVQSTFENKDKMQAYLANIQGLTEHISVMYQIKKQKLKLCEHGKDEGYDWPVLPSDYEQRRDIMLNYFRQKAKTDEIFIYQSAKNTYDYIGYDRQSGEVKIDVVTEEIKRIGKTEKKLILEQAKIELGYSPKQDEIKPGMSQQSSGSSFLSPKIDVDVQLEMLLEDAKAKLIMSHSRLLENPSLLEPNAIHAIDELEVIVNKIKTFVLNAQKSSTSIQHINQ